MPRVVANGALRPCRPTTCTSPVSVAYCNSRNNGESAIPIYYNTRYSLSRSTESYALDMSNWHIHSGSFLARAQSIVVRMFVSAVSTLRPGQKPCQLAEYNRVTIGFKRSTQIFITNRYHALVTLMGLKLHASFVSLPDFGMADSITLKSSGVS